MALTFLELIGSLEKSNETERLGIAKQVSQFLQEDIALSAMVTRGLVAELIGCIADLQTISEEDAFKVRSSVYRDWDGLYKISLGVSFIQDYRTPTADLENTILSSLCEMITTQNLGEIVNDVTVNHLQIRDFSNGSLL